MKKPIITNSNKLYKKAIKIIPMVVDDKAQPYLAWSNLFSTQAEESDPKR